MGMDVFGKDPTDEVGKYFRRNVWGWRPLADFIIENSPIIAAKCEHWHSNDGDGLDADDARRLADHLDQMVADGTAEVYVTQRDADLAALSMERCELCEGTGIRRDRVGIEHGQIERLIETPGHKRQGQRGWCNACDDTGEREPWARSYFLEIDDIREFAAFARASGGFEIC